MRAGRRGGGHFAIRAEPLKEATQTRRPGAAMSIAAEVAERLTSLGVSRERFQGGGLVVRSPIDGSAIGAVVETERRRCEYRRARRRLPSLARHSSAAPRRVGAPARRGVARGKSRAGTAGDARGRQDRIRRPRRSPRDDRHLRFRGRSFPPTLRPDHRLRAAGPSSPGAVASDRPGRRHLGVQFPCRCVVLERGAGVGLRRQRHLETVGEGAADGARHRGDFFPCGAWFRRGARGSGRHC